MLAMQRKTVFSILSVCLFMLFAFACSKEELTTKPKVELKDIEQREVPFRGVVRLNLMVYDKENDVTAVYLMPEVRGCNTFEEFYTFPMPEYTPPAGQGAEVEISLSNGVLSDYQVYPRYCTGNDTTHFRVWVMDREGNSSDTIRTAEPFVIRAS